MLQPREKKVSVRRITARCLTPWHSFPLLSRVKRYPNVIRVVCDLRQGELALCIV